MPKAKTVQSEEFSLQKSLQELESIEAYFQKPDMDLQAAIGKYQEALSLSKDIISYLSQVESQIEEIKPL